MRRAEFGTKRQAVREVQRLRHAIALEYAKVDEATKIKDGFARESLALKAHKERLTNERDAAVEIATEWENVAHHLIASYGSVIEALEQVVFNLKSGANAMVRTIGDGEKASAREAMATAWRVANDLDYGREAVQRFKHNKTVYEDSVKKLTERANQPSQPSQPNTTP